VNEWLDPLGPGPTLKPEADFGGERRYVDQAKAHQSLKDRPRAEFLLRTGTSAPVDFLAPLQIRVHFDQASVVQFTGFADVAEPTEEGTLVSGVGATELAERIATRARAANIPIPEYVYILARSAGMPDSRLQIHGSENAPREVFQVLMPVTGVAITEAFRVGAVELVPRLHDGHDYAALFAQFTDVACVAITYQVGDNVYQAEQEAISRIRLAVDSLLTTVLYGLSTLPNGSKYRYSRAQGRARPALADYVATRGLASDRLLIRELASELADSQLDVSDHARQWNGLLSPGAPAVLANALSALRRAADAHVPPVQRVQALWDAIEFLVAGAKVTRRFSAAERKALCAAATNSTPLSPDQQDRVGRVIAMLNEPSMAMKLEVTAANCGVPLRESEKELLHRLREKRNDSAHGRPSDEASEEDIRWAASIVARIAVFKWEKELHNKARSRGDRSGGQ
jgi:hypothetical protein